MTYNDSLLQKGKLNMRVSFKRICDYDFNITVF